MRTTNWPSNMHALVKIVEMYARDMLAEISTIAYQADCAMSTGGVCATAVTVSVQLETISFQLEQRLNLFPGKLPLGSCTVIQ